MHEQIGAARQVALETLKPTKSQLDHGLELHRDSVVCESYGFGPYAAADSSLLKKMFERGIDRWRLRDELERMRMTGFLEDAEQQDEYFAAWEASGVTCIFKNTGFENQSLQQVIKRLAHHICVTDRLSPAVNKALTSQDVIKAHKQGQQCIFLTCNAVPLIQNWQTCESELSFIEYFYELGCRMMHLTYNRRNMLGDGCMEQADAGISDFGKCAIDEMNRLGIIIDVAHSGEQTSIQAAEYSKKPIAASHSAAFAVHQHPRNKTDQTIRAIVDKQGVVGVCAIPAFLGKSGDINAMIDHVDYIAKKFGCDHVAIGTDTIHQLAKPDDTLQSIFESTSTSRGFEFLWQQDEPLFKPQWNKDRQIQSLAWTNWPLFTVALVQRGYTDSDIQKIIGGNMLRLLDDVLNRHQ